MRAGQSVLVLGDTWNKDLLLMTSPVCALLGWKDFVSGR